MIIIKDADHEIIKIKNLLRDFFNLISFLLSAFAVSFLPEVFESLLFDCFTELISDSLKERLFFRLVSFSSRGLRANMVAFLESLIFFSSEEKETSSAQPGSVLSFISLILFFLLKRSRFMLPLFHNKGSRHCSVAESTA